MIEFYAEIRLVHISAILTSGGLLFLRGLYPVSTSWTDSSPLLR